MNRTPARSLLVVPLVLAVLAGLSGCGAEQGADSGSDSATAPAATDAGDGAGTLELTADGSAAGKCAMPSAQVLAGFDTAFSGTVTSLDAGTATLDVDEWYAGDEAATVTVTSPEEDLQALLLAVDFEVGHHYLVSADGDRVSLCGYSAEVTPETQALYDEAFGG
ncbi:hypothetical protein ASG76_09060 [Nocardioides sp. Soil774]|uniref:hypothetical protein n=1 Tax=Nocardioides sp. Soil774 TaxID=1736408 RepID=UPI0006F95E1B|nr:hypothetical protein [Nocardioides sp. Soil774]KRE95749.1 hypothetical protein ASG76_09060 [Nocardioides sp. Soil774]